MTSHDDARVAELDQLRLKNILLREQVRRLERETTALRAVVAKVKRLTIWDFTPYAAPLDDSWLALDRTSAMDLMRSLAETDHWRPWQSRIEPRPQP